MSERYVPRKHYTEAELLQYAIEDLEEDIRCAIRDGQIEYAAKCQTDIERLRAGESVNSVLKLPRV